MKIRILVTNWSWEPPAPPPSDLGRQQCQHMVNNAELYGNLEWRERRYGGRGKIPQHCQKVARYEIDGKGYCRQHAGQLALEHLIKQSEKNND